MYFNIYIYIGNFDVSTLHGPYKDLGGFLVVIYVVFVLVLLLNLLIARMAVRFYFYNNILFILFIY